MIYFTLDFPPLPCVIFLIETPGGAATGENVRQVVSKTFEGDIGGFWVDVEKADDMQHYYRQY